MKTALILAFLLVTISSYGQTGKPAYVSLSYFGETISHPGLRIGLNYNLESWKREKTTSGGDTKTFEKRIVISPGAGFFYHKDFKTGIFILPEAGYLRRSEKGNTFGFGMSLGYLYSVMPNSYEFSNNEIRKFTNGNSKIITGCFVTLGKEINDHLSWFFKPQFLYAFPNAGKGVGFIAVELGVNYHLK